LTSVETLPATAVPIVAKAKQQYALGYLRAFLVMLVVAHHAALAYFPYAPPPNASLVTQPRWWPAFPVVDSHKWSGSSLFVGFNDIFFMSLMFFLSGLFVWYGLERKGCGTFLRDRLLRLGLPFLFAAAILAPLAYYPSYLETTNHEGIAQFIRQWLSLGQWPAGPAWFIWVLLVFDCIATGIFAVAPKRGGSLGRFILGASRRPVAFFALVVIISGIAYLPMAYVFTSASWTAFGPFAFQTSRIIHYFAYFLIAVGLGASGLDHGLFSADGKLARRWPLWVTACLALFAGVSVIAIITLTSHAQSHAWATAFDGGFVLSCAASSFAFLSLFLRFAQSRTRILDSFSMNSYAIYLLHYAIVSWFQYALLHASLPPLAKAAAVFLGAVGLSWSIAAMVRRIPAVARVI
jgi:peptidoglycan/LPS O-acetylase OafA/YrhL